MVTNEHRLIDLRRPDGCLGPQAAHVVAKPGSSERDNDAGIWESLQHYGASYLQRLHGPFSAVAINPTSNTCLIARDPFGECPLHVLAAPDRLYVANKISDIMQRAGMQYCYENVFSFPHGRWQQVKFYDTYIDLPPTQQYVDYGKLLEEAEQECHSLPLDSRLEIMRTICHTAIGRRLLNSSDDQVCVLLSGGADSFFVALLLRDFAPGLTACTLATHEDQDDVVRARQFAAALKLPHRIYYVDAQEIAATYEEAVEASECYHVFNLYCAVAMLLLGRRIRQEGFNLAFCGEGVNEAVGDYRSWFVPARQALSDVCMQRIDSDFISSVGGRARMLWGAPEYSGKLNRQLGSGLAKHATSRMVKPFMGLGLRLACPYYELEFMRRLVVLPASVIAGLGGKPGLFSRIFSRELASVPGHETLLQDCSKVRFQDGGVNDPNSISSVLFARGFDQIDAVKRFNRSFGANLDPELTTLRLSGGAEA